MFAPPATELRRHTPQVPWTYAQLDQRQREIAERVRKGGAGAFLLSELAPVITVGRRAPAADLLAGAGTEVYPVDRGGLATYHGPGQWVLFAVDSLERLTRDRRGVRKSVEALLAIARDVGRGYRDDVEVREGAEMGVWSRSRGKFAAVGVHVSQGVLLHGLSINAYRTRESFVGLRPCGLDAPVDFLLESGGPIDEALEPRFLRMGEEILAAARRHFYLGAEWDL